MGDRTSVVLSVPKEYGDIVKTIYKDDWNDCWDGEDEVSEFYFDEVNYGILHNLDELKRRGIAYTSSWQAGCEYGPGSTSLRFDPKGFPIEKEIYDSELNPPLDKLVSLLHFPDQLKEYILKFQEEVSILSWENQVEYGKIYQARQLIISTALETI